MDRYATSTSPMNTRAWFVDLPEELITYIISFLPTPCDKFALSRTGSRNLYRIATYELLKTDYRTRESALSWACCNGDTTLLHTIFQLGADANLVFRTPIRCPRCDDHIPRSPLSLAISHQQIDIVKILLNKYHADATCPDSGGSALFECALGSTIEQENKIHLMDLLLLHGVEHDDDRYYGESLGCSPILKVFQDDRIPSRILKELISPRPDRCYPYVSFHSSEYTDGLQQLYSPEIESFTSTQVEKLMVLRDATISIPGNYLTTPEAIRFRSLFDFLTLRGSTKPDLSITKHKQMLAIELHNYPAINELEPIHGSTVWSLAINTIYRYIPSQSDKTPYEQPNVEPEGMLSMLQMVLDAGADPRRSYDAQREYTPRYYSGFCGSGHYGWKTPLSCLCATWLHRVPKINEIVDFLVRAGEPVDAQDPGGLTALHFASKFVHPDLVQQLISYGADVSMVNTEGLSALHFVSQYDSSINQRGRTITYPSIHAELIKRRSHTAHILLAHGADPSAPDESGFTPLHYACMGGFFEVVLLLIVDPQVDVNAKTHELGTALHCLPKQVESREIHRVNPRVEDKVKIAEILIGAGADVRALDGNNWLPIMHARRYEIPELVNVFLAHGGDDGFGFG
ncbi:ankyrin [Daldinia eschscholtzii]|nr:ankyrin [Daldinia eschscholtzii]